MRFRLYLVVLLALLSATAHADKQLELYPLNYRSAEQLLPLLRPHVGPDATLSGQGNQLVVRATPAVQQEIGALIKVLDTPPRSLRISVRTASDLASEQSGIGGRFGAPPAQAQIEIYRSESARGERLRQTVRALEGHPAFIARSVRVPVRQRAVVVGEQTGVAEQVEMLELSKGFSATAHLHGGEVEVSISAEQADAGAGPIERHQVVSTLRGRIGEWLPVGSGITGSERSERGLTYRSSDARRDSHHVWLKVDVLD